MPSTAWTPQSGIGQVLPQDGIYLQDNEGNLIVTNLLEFFVPNPTYTIGKNPTEWVAS